MVPSFVTLPGDASTKRRTLDKPVPVKPAPVEVTVSYRDVSAPALPIDALPLKMLWRLAPAVAEDLRTPRLDKATALPPAPDKEMLATSDSTPLAAVCVMAPTVPPGPTSGVESATTRTLTSVAHTGLASPISARKARQARGAVGDLKVDMGPDGWISVMTFFLSTLQCTKRLGLA